MDLLVRIEIARRRKRRFVRERARQGDRAQLRESAQEGRSGFQTVNSSFLRPRYHGFDARRARR